MHERLLTVVIPVHNGLPHLLEQLDALAAATASLDVDLLVVDNRSTDDSRQATTDWSRRHHVPVRVLDADEYASEAHARNVGTAAATTPFLAFCDADDVVAPSWATALVDALASGAEYATGPVDVDRLNPAWLRESRGRAVFERPALFEGTVPFAHGCNMAFRTETLRRLGPFQDLAAGTDIEMALRAWTAGVELVWVPDALVHYRLRADLGALYRQGRAYGRCRRGLRRHIPEHVDDRANRRAQLRRVGWLARHVPATVTDRAMRARWLWVLAQLDGEARALLRARRPTA